MPTFTFIAILTGRDYDSFLSRNEETYVPHLEITYSYMLQKAKESFFQNTEQFPIFPFGVREVGLRPSISCGLSDNSVSLSESWI